MAALDLLGRRWALRLLWELRDGPHGARELRQRCDAMSPSVLYQRLAELGTAGLLEQDADSRYRLTALGDSLGSAIAPLDRWARTWAARAAPDRAWPPDRQAVGPAGEPFDETRVGLDHLAFRVETDAEVAGGGDAHSDS